MFGGTIGAILVMRLQYPECMESLRNSWWSRSSCWGVGLTADRQLGVGLGIVLAAILVKRDPLRSFVRTAISDRVYIDTLSFLAPIFSIYPLPPTGSYGPFGFFEPRKHSLFVILFRGSHTEVTLLTSSPAASAAHYSLQ